MWDRLPAGQTGKMPVLHILQLLKFQLDRLRILCRMRVPGALIHLEPLEHMVAELVLGQHAADGELNDPLGMLGQHGGNRLDLTATGMVAVTVVFHLLQPV